MGHSESTSLVKHLGDWTAHKTEAGIIYYYNALTGVSTYEKPSGFKGEVFSLKFSLVLNVNKFLFVYMLIYLLISRSLFHPSLSALASHHQFFLLFVLVVLFWLH